jgi:GNAT superfamily N-acetyltransferase
MNCEIAPFAPADRKAWEALARGYKAFYETEVPDAGYEEAWRRLLARDGVYGLGAKIQGRLVGIAHYLFHTSTWARNVCYLQDLFVTPEKRGQGVARALIEAVADAARASGAERYYWLTQEQNAVARVLYDKVGKFHGFIRYDYPL